MHEWNNGWKDERTEERRKDGPKVKRKNPKVDGMTELMEERAIDGHWRTQEQTAGWIKDDTFIAVV